MNDLFDIVSVILAVSIALTLGFFLKWFFLLIKNVRKKNTGVVTKKRHAMEACCVCLSIAIASVAVILIWTEWQSILCNLSFEDMLYYVVLLLSFLISVVFFRVLAPVMLGLYALYCCVFLLLLVNSYTALPKDFSVEVSQGESVEFQSLTLSYKNLLPMPRYWVNVPVATAQSESSLDNSIIFAPLIEQFGKESFVTKIIVLLSSLVMEKEVGFKTMRVEASSDNTLSKTFNFSLYGKNSVIQVESF